MPQIECKYCGCIFRSNDYEREACDDCEGDGLEYSGSEYESADDAMFNEWKESNDTDE